MLCLLFDSMYSLRLQKVPIGRDISFMLNFSAQVVYLLFCADSFTDAVFEPWLMHINIQLQNNKNQPDFRCWRFCIILHHRRLCSNDEICYDDLARPNICMANKRHNTMG